MKTAEFFRNRKVRRAAVVLACIVLVYGGLRLYGWAEPRIYYASLDRQEWREDMAGAAGREGAAEEHGDVALSSGFQQMGGFGAY